MSPHKFRYYVCHNCRIAYGHQRVWCPGCPNQMVQERWTNKEYEEFKNRDGYVGEYDSQQAYEYTYMGRVYPRDLYGRTVRTAAAEAFIKRFNLDIKPEDCRFKYHEKERFFSAYHEDKNGRIAATADDEEFIYRFRLNSEEIKRKQ